MKFSRRKLLVGGGLFLGAGAAGFTYRRHMAASSSRKLLLTSVDEIPPAGASLDFLVTGDSGQDSTDRKEVVEAMVRSHEASPAAFLMLTGDNVYPAGIETADDPAMKLHIEDAFAPLITDMPIYPCLGNHDHYGNPDAQVEYAKSHAFWKLPSRYHSFTKPVSTESQAEFFVLDTSPIRELQFSQLRHPDQVAWCEEALARSTAQWKVAVGHHPFTSGGPKGGSSKVQWAFAPGFAEFDVDLYFAGHNHDQELIDTGSGCLQVVSGAGAAPQEVHDVDGTQFMASGGGFTRVSLREDAAWLEFVSPEETLAMYKVERV